MKVRSGRLTAAIGSSRSGKTQYVQSQMAGKDRVLVWDIKGEYPAKFRARTRAELLRIVMSYSGKPGIIAFTPDRLTDFEFFCKAAKTWVKSHYLAGKNSVLIFEETADVTSPGKAQMSMALFCAGTCHMVSIFLRSLSARPSQIKRLWAMRQSYTCADYSWLVIEDQRRMTRVSLWRRSKSSGQISRRGSLILLISTLAEVFGAQVCSSSFVISPNLAM